MTNTHNFEADTGKILDIVINSLYSQKEIFLRELISNASDAINKRRYESNTNKILVSKNDSEIILEADKKKKTLIIKDNGIGLSKEDMVEALGTIARSGTKAFLETLQDTKSKKQNAGAVLIRGIYPQDGIKIMNKNRGIKDINKITNGPGKLSMAINVTMKENNIDLKTMHVVDVLSSGW